MFGGKEGPHYEDPALDMRFGEYKAVKIHAFDMQELPAQGRALQRPRESTYVILTLVLR